MGLTPRVAKFVYAVVGTLALVLALVRIQSGYLPGALFAGAVAAFAGFRLYQFMQEED